MLNNNLKIELKDYCHRCSDGCCIDYGTIIIINGVELELHNQDVETILQQILEYLNHEINSELLENLELKYPDTSLISIIQIILESLGYNVEINYE